MKKILVAVIGMLCAMAWVVNAQDAAAKPAKKTKKAGEQQTWQKEMLDKDVTDKDGKLDKAEKGKISTEDQDKMTKAGLLKATKKANNATPAAPATPAPA